VNKVLLQAVDQPVDEFKRIAESYSAREDALLLVRQLNRLIKAVQRHRGISMGLLAGNRDYQKEFKQLQTQLERRLATLEVFAATNQLLTDSDKKNLADAWVTIRSDWEGDNVNDNFELHSHLIQQLLNMIETLAVRLKHSLYDIKDIQASKELEKKGELLDFTCSTLPALIEDVARIRGATSYMVAVGSLHGLDESKIRFWMSNIRGHCQVVGEQFSKLEPLGDVVSFKRISVKQAEVMLLKFLEVADSVAFLGHASLVGSTNIFNLATEVIERYWATVNQGLDLIQAEHMEDLDDWMDRT